MEIINKTVLIIVPKKDLFDLFMTNTIKLGIPNGIEIACLEFENYQKFDASKLLEKVKYSLNSNFVQGIVLFPQEEISYEFKHEKMPILNDSLFSNGVKQMSGITVGKNGCLEYDITRILKNRFIRNSKKNLLKISFINVGNL